MGWALSDAFVVILEVNIAHYTLVREKQGLGAQRAETWELKWRGLQLPG